MTDSTTFNHYLIIDTDSYAGDFERELVAFVFGIVDEYEQDSSYYSNLTDEEKIDVEVFTGGEDEDGIVEWEYGEWGLSAQTIVSPLENEDFVWARSVQVKIMSEHWDKITLEVLGKLRGRANRFCKLYGVEFTGLRHLEQTVESTYEVI
jgi:hypothetical protein